MKHDIHLDGYGLRLRPVTREDAAFIHELRRRPDVAQYIGETDERLSVQESWLVSYFERIDDFYFLIETTSKQPVGTIGLYQMTDTTAEWGRWIVTPGVPAAPASALLLYQAAFQLFGLQRVYCRTVAANQHVVSFHDSTGIPRSHVEKNGVVINGVSYDMIVHEASADLFPAIQKRLQTPARFAERLLQEVENK